MSSADTMTGRAVDVIERAEARGWNAALVAVEEAVGGLTGLDVTVRRGSTQWRPDFGHSEAFTMPPAQVTVVNGSGPLIVRAETLAAIASLRKPEQSSASEPPSKPPNLGPLGAAWAVQSRKRTDWSNVVVDEGDEAP